MVKVFLLLFARLAAAGALWSTSPAVSTDVMRQAYCVGNGRLGAMPFGQPGQEMLNLNIDTLWSGGPFQLSTYNGGNPNTSMIDVLAEVRAETWSTGITNDTALHGDTSAYGSFKAAGNLSVTIDGIRDDFSSFNRSLDLKTGIHTTSFSTDVANFTSTVYCTLPDQVCVYNLESSDFLPQVAIALGNIVSSNQGGLTLGCNSQSASLTGYTQNSNPIGMKWDIIAQNSTPGTCNNETGTLVVPGNSSSALTIVIGAGTNYDQTKGTREYNYSFQGADPAPLVAETVSKAIQIPEKELRAAHVADYSNFESRFLLSLPDTQGSSGVSLDLLLTNYNSNLTSGDPYLEKLMFDYGRHLLIGSSRDNSLPPNLQGVWSNLDSAAWSGDYHANINLQMNLWPAQQTGLGELLVSVWNYMENTWVPRGTETAQLLYGASGWVTHDEMNIFGHTGEAIMPCRMKSYETSADYAIAPAWMMQHVWDNYEYSQDSQWWSEQGWPLLKGAAEFWLNQLQVDQFSNDSSLVVVPCISPEHGPATFGCTHWQQLLHQLFEIVLVGAPAANDNDNEFLANITTLLASVDKGLHFGTWGQIKEWKVPESVYNDYKNDQHRHISELVGWYPGWSINSLQCGYSNSTIQTAVNTTLTSRGTGFENSDPGWAKAWRSACWALLNNTERAYYEYRYTIDENFASNGLSFSSGAPGSLQPYGAFQIDANFGLVGAGLSMLAVDLPVSSSFDGTREVVLGPAIPAAWAGGNVQGLRIRGGGSVDFDWDDAGVVHQVTARDLATNVRLLNIEGDVLYP
ncbi:hypothetical protein PFICI_10436 [Pestalotiopsis fici W106-1]|uniref:Uncharacterized protein n=1 Tax=Pestalotiopsis fici (strain W106-1 / CGMCC3.15140) TaxID=1229662 RepID=W3WX52_PESFW|nr:uncharacterized protein PFICI_10436 [Pestalotiopsis fici W106-1]ETS78374.1 hypothetical protein PFICI_10436 [Pestalotiopsis fici W106-1]